MIITLISACDKSTNYRKGENLGLKALEAYLKEKNITVYIYDLNNNYIDDATLCQNILKNGSSLVGFSVSFTHQIYETIRLAQYLKQFFPNKHFTLGGQGASFILDKVLKEHSFFDTGIFGEGEEALYELVCSVALKKDFSNIKGLYINNGEEVVFTGYREPIIDLDTLPFIQHDAIFSKSQNNHFAMISSRGCVGKCTFCTSGYLQNKYHNSTKWRYRSAENIVKEIEMLTSILDNVLISFVDDNFLGGTPEGLNRAIKFAEIIIEKGINIKWSIECRVCDVDYALFKKLKQAGLCNVFLGVESGNEQDLKLFNKRITVDDTQKAFEILKKLNLEFDIGFIMFHPTSTVAQLETNVTFLKRNDLAFSTKLNNCLTLYYGLPLISHYQKKELIQIDRYTIKYKYEFDEVKKIFTFVQNTFNKFEKIEQKLCEIIFEAQMRYDDITLWNNYYKYKNCKHTLSEFEADLFLQICSSINHYPDNDFSCFLTDIDTFLSTYQQKVEEVKY